jgi:hypothetical protein
MDMDHERYFFELWMKGDLSEVDAIPLLRRYPDKIDQYEVELVQSAWAAWKAKCEPLPSNDNRMLSKAADLLRDVLPYVHGTAGAGALARRIQGFLRAVPEGSPRGTMDNNEGTTASQVKQ